MLPRGAPPIVGRCPARSFVRWRSGQTALLPSQELRGSFAWSKPDVHGQAVTVARVGRPEPCGLAFGDQERRAADGDGVENVVARRARQAFDGRLEAVPGQQLAPFGIAVRPALL